MRRVYKTVTVIAEAAGGFGVALDGRVLRTPGRAPLTVPFRALAEAVAMEWDAQAERVDPTSMPMMQYAATAIDRVAPNHAEVAALTARYAQTDLICHRAQHPEALQQRQAEAWDGLLDWFAADTGLRLIPVAGVLPKPQDEGGIARLEARFAALDPFQLAGLSAATGALGSVILALALTRGRLDADEAFRLSRIDESWQAEHWGRDAEEEARAERLRLDIVDTGRFLSLLEQA